MQPIGNIACTRSVADPAGVKLLLDANLSYRMLVELEAAFPGSQQVSRLRLGAATDREVWDYARERGYVLVSKDSDFQELATLYGVPPKVIWLKCGNQSRRYIVDLLLGHSADIHAFGVDPDATVAEVW